MNLPLFSEFSAADKSVWKQQVIKDLKGKDFDTNLLWSTPEGLEVQPYYAAEDLTDERLAVVQSIQQKPLGWLNQPVVCAQHRRDWNDVPDCLGRPDRIELLRPDAGHRRQFRELQRSGVFCTRRLFADRWLVPHEVLDEDRDH